MKRQIIRKDGKKTRFVRTIWIITLILMSLISGINRQNVYAYCKNPAYGIRQMEEIDASDVDTSRDRIIDAAREVVKRSASTYGGNVGGVERPTNFVLQNTVYYKWYGYQDDVTKHQFDLSCVNQTTHIIYQSTATKQRVDIQWVAGEWANGGWTVGRWQDVSHRDLLSNSYSYYVTNGLVFQQLAVDRFWEEIRQYPKLYDVRRYDVLRQQNFDKSRVRIGDVLFTGYEQADGNINRMHCMFVIGKLSAEEKEGFVFDEACPWREDKMFMASTGPEKNGRLVYTDLLDTPFADDPGKGYYIYAVARPLFMNQPAYGGFMIKKTGSDGIALDGAEFELVNEEGVKCRHFKVSQDGYISEMDLIPGNYSLVETKAPEGYVLDSTPCPLTIVEDDINRLYWDNPIPNEKVTGRIKIVKTNKEGSPISGATFDVLNGSTVIATLTTDDSGEAVSTSLPFGTYTILETHVPSPYLLKEQSYIVSIAEHGKTEILNVQNEKLEVRVRAIKRDTLTEVPIHGAVFQVLDSQGNVVSFDVLEDDHIVKKDRFTTNRDGVAVTEGLLSVGTYTLREIEAPQGYILMEDISFEVTVDMEMTILHDLGRTVTFEVENKPTEVVISKKLLTGEEELAGAHLQVIHEATGDLIDEWVSDKSPRLIRYLTAGDTYILREIMAPEGYSLAEDIRFIVEGTDKAQYVTMRNDRTRVDILKQDADTNMPLSGTKFAIYQIGDGEEQVPLSFTLNDGVYVYDSEGDIITLTTNDNGLVTIEKLPIGKYLCQETTAPEGYFQDDTPYELIVEATSENVPLLIENEAFRLLPAVVKTGEKMPNALIPVGLGLATLSTLGGVIILERNERKRSKTDKTR